MGCLQSSSLAVDATEAKINHDIQKDQQKAAREDEDKVRLIILGTGDSGKSTIFKQMRILYGEPWDNSELAEFIPVVFANVVVNLLQVLQVIPDAESWALKDTANKFKCLDKDTKLSKEHCAWIKDLWADRKVQSAWSRRNEYQVLECLEYFCREVDRITDPGYVPSQQDVLQARVRTTGIIEEKYDIDGTTFIMYDVGGQRNERKKWIHAFENIPAMIFVVAISEYDQSLFEDSRTNRVDEAVNLFDEVSNSLWFIKTSIILFLNKNDLFLQKLRVVPFRVEGVRNDAFLGPYAEDNKADFSECVDAAHVYLKQLFSSKVQDKKRQVYPHITEATDTTQTSVVLNSCKDIILRRNLATGGFV